jgi:hypothetical protein
MQFASNPPFGNRPFRSVPNYQLTSWVFLRLLAVVYFIAFASLSVQITGLAGPDGILPFDHVLDAVYQNSGRKAWILLPNIFWLNASDAALSGAAIAGCIASVLLVFGRCERFAWIVVFALYLSLFHAGQIFLSFQWDTLLLEAGFLAIFLRSGPSWLLILLYEWLLFRFRFMSGVAKLAFGDPSWLDFSALHFYFETQPLPHVGSWYAHFLPQWLQTFGVGFTYFTELIVPFFIFMPRSFRITAALITILTQLLIIATSNHNFVNLLVIALCVLLLDDQIIARFIPRRLLHWIHLGRQNPGWVKRIAISVFGLLILFSSTTSFYLYVTRNPLPNTIVQMNYAIHAWGIGHIYHIFPTMQRQRQELTIQGSNDGKDWKDYEFKYKPGPPGTRPAFVMPHHPRLDWMMWFVPTQSSLQLYWFNRLQNRLKLGSPQVLALLKTNPFPDKAPRFLRVRAYEYRFTTAEERARTGNWWKRDYLGFFPYVAPRRP